ncbi:MAG: hypothetical protein WBB94_02420 [Candidatus Saccharimonadaceae bacterium]
MGLIDRISAANSVALVRDTAAMLDEETRRREILQSRAGITRAHMEQVAFEMNCEIVCIGMFRGGSYYVIDDLILCVREQSHIEQGKMLFTEVREVLWQHFVYLVGLALNGTVVYTKIGVLKLLNFDGIMAAYNSSCTRTFDRELVQSALPFDN